MGRVVAMGVAWLIACQTLACGGNDDGAAAGDAGADADQSADAAMPDAGPSADAALLDADPNEDALSIPGMVKVPAGSFVMGSDPGEGISDERPEHFVKLSPFYIDVHEVTNAEWRACVTGGGCTEPLLSDSATRTGYYADPTYDDYPVIYVNWTQANEYCAWAGKRLPTEAEWEKAARGGCELEAPSSCGEEDERTYPWGDAEPTCGLANYDHDCVGDTDAVGARSPAGDSPYGAQDMAGNVWEWVADCYEENYYQASPVEDPPGPTCSALRVVRGGYWYGGEGIIRVASRYYHGPFEPSYTLGLRCARNP